MLVGCWLLSLCLALPKGERRDRLFSRICCDRTRGNGFFLMDMRKKFVTIREVRYWHRLPIEVVEASSWRHPRSI